jgi:hypothetical protein
MLTPGMMHAPAILRDETFYQEKNPCVNSCV